MSPLYLELDLYLIQILCQYQTSHEYSEHLIYCSPTDSLNCLCLLQSLVQSPFLVLEYPWSPEFLVLKWTQPNFVALPPLRVADEDLLVFVLPLQPFAQQLASFARLQLPARPGPLWRLSSWDSGSAVDCARSGIISVSMYSGEQKHYRLS